MKKTDLFFAFILVPIDIVMIIAAFIAAYYFRIELEVVPAFSDIGLQEYLRYSLYLIPVWIALFATNGLYYIRKNPSYANEISRIMISSSTALLFLIVGIFLSHTYFFSRLILVFTWVLSILFISFGRLVVRTIRQYLYKYGIGRRNILIVGDNFTSDNLSKQLSSNYSLGYKVSGIILTDEGTESKYGLKVIGKLEDIDQVIKNYFIDEVTLTEMSLPKGKILDIIQACSDACATFKYIPDTFSLMSLNVTSGLIGNMPVIELKAIPLDGWGRIIKRIIDVFFAFIFMVILSPLFLLIALLEKMTSRGPILYSQERVGRDEKTFLCYKFRSMYIDQCDFSKGGSKWTTKQDEGSRITPLGKFLRKSNLDELPQLWNIFCGDMSFVGPRPEQPKFVKKFENEIPDYFRRHRVKSGLTGWAQVNGLKGDTSIKERVRFDIYYIENWSLLFDLKILLKTFWLTVYEAIIGKYEYRSGS